MPFIMRQVQPVSLARVEKGDEASDGPIDSLADIQIRVLTNIIEQLGDISHHASEIINNIGEECEKINNRTENITSRVSAVQKTVDEMKVDEKTPVMIDEQGVSSDLTDGNLFTPESRPKIITEKYLKADPMPNLEILQQYRDDDKQSNSFYSFPGYFFELWKAQFQEAARIEKEKRKEERRERKRNRAEKPKRNIVSYVRIETKADRIRKKMEEEGKIMAQGPNVISQNISFDFETLPSVPDEIFRSDIDTAEHSILSIMDNDTSSISPSSVISPPETPISSPLPSSTIPPPPGPIGITESPVSIPATSTSPVPPLAPSFSGPPPPPAPSGPPPPPPPSTGGPPPPPGPPLLTGTAGPSVSPAPVQKASGNLSMMEQLQQAKLKTSSKVEQAPKSVDTRSDLLTQIQMGRNLKKVQKTEKVMNKRMSGIAGVFEDAMKSRREHFESDDEDDYDSDSSSEWDD